MRLAVKGSRDERDRASRNQLAHEYDSTSPFVRALPPDVKSQIHFLEITVKGNRQADEARVEKQKTDDADECLAIVEIQLCFDGNQRLQNFRVDGEIQHRQITPIRRKE